MKLLPAVAIHQITTSHPHDCNLDGPEYAGNFELAVMLRNTVLQALAEFPEDEARAALGRKKP